MTRESICEVLKAHAKEVASYGVVRLRLFGSVARGDARPDSDIDLLVEFGRPVGLFDFFRLQHDLERILGVPRVDLLSPSAIKPSLREHILEEAVDVA